MVTLAYWHWTLFSPNTEITISKGVKKGCLKWIYIKKWLYITGFPFTEREVGDCVNNGDSEMKKLPGGCGCPPLKEGTSFVFLRISDWRLVSFWPII